MAPNRLRLLLAAALIALVPALPAVAQTDVQSCGNPFVNHYGPYDYRATTKQQRAIVENVHFTPGIESMTRPGTTMFRDMAQDVAYTLGVYPNHHRALITMRRLAERWKRDPPPGSRLTVDCWFDRAVRFRPDDTVARALYAQFLHQQRRNDDAARQLDIAVEHAKDNALSHYNLGLVYLEIGRPERALEQAHRAMAMGFPRTELQQALQKQGRWSEPRPESSGNVAEPAAPASGISPEPTPVRSQP